MYYGGEAQISNSKLWKGEGFETFRKEVWNELSKLPHQVEKYRPRFLEEKAYHVKDVIYDVNRVAKLVMGLITIAEMEKPSSQETDHTKGTAVSHFIHSCAQTLTQLSKLHQSFGEMAKSHKDEMKAELLLDEYETMLLKMPTTLTTKYVLCNSPTCGQNHSSSSASPTATRTPNTFGGGVRSSPQFPDPLLMATAMSPATVKTIVTKKKEEMFSVNKILEDTSIDSRISVFYLSLCLVQRAVHEHPKILSWLFGKLARN